MHFPALFSIQLINRIIDSDALGKLLQPFANRVDTRLSELGIINQAFQFAAINNVEGDYFEFGLYRGKTFRFAHRMKRRYKFGKMILWGFDSFQGLPEITDERDNIWRQGAFHCSESELRAILKKHRFKEDEYVLVPGFYKDSLNDLLHERLNGRTSSVVYIDCDLYESTAQVLAFIERYLVNGTIVCFDDFYNYKGASDQGEQKALAEFLEHHPSINFIPYLYYSPLGRSFIVRRSHA